MEAVPEAAPEAAQDAGPEPAPAEPKYPLYPEPVLTEEDSLLQLLQDLPKDEAEGLLSGMDADAQAQCQAKQTLCFLLWACLALRFSFELVAAGTSR